MFCFAWLHFNCVFTDFSSTVLILLERSNCFRDSLSVLNPGIEMALPCLLLVIICGNKVLLFPMLECNFYREPGVSNVLVFTSVVDSSAQNFSLQCEWERGEVCAFPVTAEQFNWLRTRPQRRSLKYFHSKSVRGRALSPPGASGGWVFLIRYFARYKRMLLRIVSHSTWKIVWNMGDV